MNALVVLEVTALQSLRHCRHFLIDNLKWLPAKAHSHTQRLASVAIERIGENSATFPSCRLALEMGVDCYRELLIDSYRVIYRIWPEQDSVSIYLFAHQRQDVKQLLFEYQLLS